MWQSLSVLIATQVALSIVQQVLADGLKQTLASRSEVLAANPQHFIDLLISLEPQSTEVLEKTLYEISDPYSRRYGKHLTSDEAKSLLLPRKQSTESVKRWLSEAGVPDDHVRDAGASLHALVSVQHAERLWSMRFVDGPEVVEKVANSVPADMRGHIATIHPRLVLGDLNVGKENAYKEAEAGY